MIHSNLKLDGTRLMIYCSICGFALCFHSARYFSTNLNWELGFVLVWINAALLEFKAKWFCYLFIPQKGPLNKTLMNEGDGFGYFTPDEMYWVCLEI